MLVATDVIAKIATSKVNIGRLKDFYRVSI